MGASVLLGPKASTLQEHPAASDAEQERAPRLVGRGVEAERLLTLMAIASKGSGQVPLPPSRVRWAGRGGGGGSVCVCACYTGATPESDARAVRRWPC